MSSDTPDSPVTQTQLHRPPQVISTLKPLYRETALVQAGQAQATIIVPKDGSCAHIARDVADRIRAATGADVPIKTDDDLSEEDREQHLICLGQMLNNQLAFRLYVHHYITTDDWFPGPGGWELRTACDPWGNGKNVILLGGSDCDGVQRAADRFCALLKPGPDLAIPRLLDTGFRGKENLEAWLPGHLERFSEEYLGQAHLPYGNERRLIEMGRYYHLTGDDRLAEALAEGIRHWINDYCRYIPERQITQTKYNIPLMMLDWGVLEAHPAFSDDVRLEYTNLLFDYVAMMSVHWRITQLEPGVLSGTGHHRVSLTVSYGSRYFKTYYPELPMDRIDAGVASVRTGLDTIKHSYGFFDENAGYTQYYPTTTMWHSLFMADLTYFTSGNAQKWLRQSLIYLDNLGVMYCGPSESYGVGEWFYRDGKWAWLQDTLSGRSDYVPGIAQDAFDLAAWSFRPKVQPVEPTEWLEGIQWLPVHETVYALLKAQPHRVNVPREKTFHVLSLRPKYDPHAEYLRLDGLNAGLSNGGDGNAIVSLTARGQSWLASGQWGQNYHMKYHNSVMVVRDGQFPDELVALCSLESTADLPSCGLLQSVMYEYNGVDWARSIIWRKNGYFVVCDTLRARETGEYGFFCRWRTVRDGAIRDGAIQLGDAGSALDIAPVGGCRLETFTDEGVRVFSEGQHAGLEAGESRTFINLIRARGVEEAPARIVRLGPEAALVLDPAGSADPGGSGESGEPAVVGAVLPVDGEMATTTLGDGLVVCARLFHLSAHRLCAADLTRLDWDGPLLTSDVPVSVEVDLVSGAVNVTGDGAGLKVLHPGLADARGRTALREALTASLRRLAARPESKEAADVVLPQASAPNWVRPLTEAGAVRCLASGGTGGNVAAGTEDGTIVLLDADGKVLWTHRGEARINDVAVDDVDGDGRDEILAASDDYNLYCLDGAGKERWRFNTTGITITHRTRGVYGPGLHIDSEGEVAVVSPVDLRGDGRRELLVGTKTFMHGGRRVFGTLYCLGPDGRARWHLYQSGGTVSSLDTADVDGDGRQEILIGTSGTYAVADYLVDSEGEVLARYNCYEGAKEKACSFARTVEGEPPRVIRLEMSNGVVEAFGTRAPHKRLWRRSCGGLGGCGPVVGDLDGDGVEEIVVGSNAGSVYALKESDPGEVTELWRTNLQDAVSVVVIADVDGDGRPEVIAGTHGGGVYVLEGECGDVVSHRVFGDPITCVQAADEAADPTGLLVGTAGGVVMLCPAQPGEGSV